jgi:hypothetical protein
VIKSAFFRHVFANNFFVVHFFTTFSTDLKSARNATFSLTPFLKIIELGHISTFFNFDCKCAENGSKNGKSFLLMYLKIVVP